MKGKEKKTSRHRFRIIIIGVFAILLGISSLTAKYLLPNHAEAAVNIKEGKIEDIFPASYQSALRSLQDKHPNWKFKAYYTGLKWSEVFVSSGRYNETEMDLGRNLVPSSSISSWKSTTVTGSFYWSTNQWNVLSAPYWVQASEEIVKYFMDPRNFFNEEQIFQFEQLSYAEFQNLEGIENILKGSFMEASRGNKIELSDGSKVTYAEAFLKIGKEVGVSPYMLASRVKQEQGVNGDSALISGTQAFTVNGTTVSGYYNYFNIEASGKTYEEIIQNGLAEAYKNGWNTRYKALLGGAQKVAQRYIERGQDTNYFQKFNVDTDKNGVFWKQYMQNLQAPYNESARVSKAYASMGALDNPFVFVIPVFEEMPETACAKPTKDGNPNYKLALIAADGKIIDGFQADVYDYNMTVSSDKDSIYITAMAYANSEYNSNTVTTTVVNGVKGTFNQRYPLKTGLNQITINSVAENGDSRIYTLNITREQGAEEITTVSFPSYREGTDSITGIPIGTTVGTFLSKVEKSSNVEVNIYQQNGSVCSDSVTLGTGMIVRATANGSVIKELPIILYGDIDGNGTITLLDMVDVKRIILELGQYSDVSMKAADVDKNGTVTLLDMVDVKRDILELEKISQ